VERLMYNKVWLQNKNTKAMELLLQVFVMVLCKKVPTECDIKKIEKLHEKVKLLKPPSAA